MEVNVAVNGRASTVRTSRQLRERLARSASEPYREIWLDSAAGPSLCALIHGPIGWLLYLRESGHQGLSSRNPSYSGPPDAVEEYRLTNGQMDHYPRSWALPLAIVEKALLYFVETSEAAPFVAWHDDSEESPARSPTSR